MRKRIAFAAAFAATLAIAGVAAAADEPSITIQERTFVDQGTASRRTSLSGAISPGAGGEPLEILGRECGTTYPVFRIIGGTNTSLGGSWQYLVRLEDRIGSPAYFRARWRGVTSRAVLVRVPLVAFVFPGRTTRIEFDTRSSGQNLHGMRIDLQRLIAGNRWVHVRRSRITRVRGTRFEARFRATRRGLVLRGFVPAATAAPCYLPGPTGSWRT